MDILVSTLYYLLFTNSYYILHLYHNTPSVNRNAHAEPTTGLGCYFHFRPLHRPRLVPIGRSCDAGHLHANLVAEKRSESCRLKPWKAAEPPLQFAVISPISGDAITWVLLPTIPSVFSDQSQPPGGADLPLIGHWRIHGFGSSIRRHHHAWEVTTTTVGLNSAKSV